MFGTLHAAGHSPLAASAALKSALHRYVDPHVEQKREGSPVFITVSREPGAGAVTLSHQLAKRLSDITGATWSAWDRELIDRVSQEHHVDHSMLENMENRSFDWLQELLSGMTQRATREHLYVYRRTMMTIRALAEAGNSIIVGMGGAFVTSDIKGGIHVRLVAPRDHRVKWMAEKLHVDAHEAAKYVADREKAQADFFRRYWFAKTVTPEMFSITLNAAQLSLEEMVDCLIPLVRAREQAAHDRSGFAPVPGVVRAN